jgi:hypothetical protein
MITKNKQRGALLALHSILVLSRSLAYEAKSSDLAVILDVAEYLPLLMLEPDDRTEPFREQLVGLAQRYPAFTHALEQFDGAG